MTRPVRYGRTILEEEEEEQTDILCEECDATVKYCVCQMAASTTPDKRVRKTKKTNYRRRAPKRSKKPNKSNSSAWRLRALAADRTESPPTRRLPLASSLGPRLLYGVGLSCAVGARAWVCAIISRPSFPAAALQSMRTCDVREATYCGRARFALTSFQGQGAMFEKSAP